MAECVKRAQPHPLQATLNLLEVNKTEIARRYGCSTNFLHSCLSGRYPMPERLERLVRETIEERVWFLQGVLVQTQTRHPWIGGLYSEATGRAGTINRIENSARALAEQDAQP